MNNVVSSLDKYVLNVKARCCLVYDGHEKNGQQVVKIRVVK